ncbi:unnamed protein product [Cuscuta campestris]|uniref:Reverse transcriptase domain-containing protein n=1 Tax=Cuscuta campestris TaxID=132261 RepID=A0A484MP80_9ASTE|nr:unnamed protein product [Cuscuta campestris]
MDDSYMNQVQPIELEGIESDRESEENFINEAGYSDPNLKDLEEFNDCIEACGLTAPPFCGGIFTWTGTRSKGKLWRRLDRVLNNQSANEAFNDINLTHLSKTTSDHKPLFIQCKVDGFQGPKPFRFLNVWTHHHNFLDVVSNYWENNPRTGGMSGLAHKLKGLKPILTHWNKNHFGNIFQEVKDNELKAARAQEEYESDPSDDKRTLAHQASANLIISLNKEPKESLIPNYLDKVVDDRDNQLISTLPNEADVYKAIMSLNPDSAAGPDGFNGRFFFRTCWNIIKVDVLLACQEEQTGFQKNKGVEEQILLAEEMVHMIDKEVRGDNCIIKLDMAKAFDRVDLRYLINILGQLGFNSHSQKLLMANLVGSYLSVLINGSPAGFFQIKRGVKQGDPLSPLLFLISSECFSRMIKFHMNTSSLGSFNTGNHPLISHLAFADDLVIFLNGDTRNLKKFRRILEDYQQGSGQQVNLNESSFYKGKKVNQAKLGSMARSLGMDHGDLPFTYLGARMVKGKLRKHHCSKLHNQFDKYLNSWYSTTLNPMGRLVLIKHVLSSIPLHITAVHIIPQSIIHTLHKKMANFLWGFKNGKPKYHWSKWINLCVPTNEGGLSLRSLDDIQDAYSIKLWWKVQTDNTMWARFMRAKYLSRSDFKERQGFMILRPGREYAGSIPLQGSIPQG